MLTAGMSDKEGEEKQGGGGGSDAVNHSLHKERQIQEQREENPDSNWPKEEADSSSIPHCKGTQASSSTAKLEPEETTRQAETPPVEHNGEDIAVRCQKTSYPSSKQFCFQPYLCTEWRRKSSAT